MSSFQLGGTKLERFLLKNQHTSRKLLNFENWCSGELWKIGHHFRKQSYLKMSITKNVLLNWYSSMKKNEKDLDDFWHRKLTLKVKFCHFLTLFERLPLLQNLKFLWLLLTNFVSPVWKVHNPYYHNLGVSVLHYFTIRPSK